MLKRLFRDTGFALAVEISHRAANVILYAAVSYFLGAHDAGVYTLAFSYVLIATRMTFWGLDQLLIRETSKNPAKLPAIFSNFVFLRLGLSLLGWAILYGIATYLLPQSDVRTRTLMLIYGLSILPESLINLFQAVLIAQQRMHLTVIARLIETAVKVVGGVAALAIGADLAVLVWMVVLGSVVGMLVLLVSVLRQHLPFSWRMEPRFCYEQLRIATPLMIGGMFYIFDNRFDILILSFFLNEAAIGIYNAALTIISTLMIVPQAYQVAVFPLMGQLYSTSADALSRLYHYSLKYMLLLSLFFAVLLTFVPAPLVRLFGPEFEAAAPMLRILAWSLPPLFYNVPVARLLITDNRQGVTARTMALRVLLGALFGVLLTWRFQGLGAAASRVIASTIPVAVNYLYASRHIVSPKGMRVLWLQVLTACSGMGAVLVLLKSFFPGDVLLASLAFFLLLMVTQAFSREEYHLLKRLHQALWFRLRRFFPFGGSAG